MKKIAIASALLLAATASACAPATRFEWGAYESTLYAYTKTPTARDAYRTSLVEALRKGEETGRVAPGLNAELGYLYMEDGQTADAIRYFEIEKRQFPESQRFMDGVISRLRSNTTQGAAQ